MKQCSYVDMGPRNNEKLNIELLKEFYYFIKFVFL